MDDVNQLDRLFGYFSSRKKLPCPFNVTSGFGAQPQKSKKRSWALRKRCPVLNYFQSLVFSVCNPSLSRFPAGRLGRCSSAGKHQSRDEAIFKVIDHPKAQHQDQQ